MSLPTEMPTSTTIVSFPDDVLNEIFTLAQASPFVLGELPSRIAVSHVSKHWRSLTIRSPLLWVTIRVTSHSNLDALREILRRSESCELDISFISAGKGSPARRRGHFGHLRDAALLLLKHVIHWRSLSVTSPSKSLNIIMQLLNHVPIPKLQRLQLIQSGEKAAVSHCGPLVLNPSVFSTLSLQGVTIHCISPSNLAGVTSIDFSDTASCIIDQANLDTLSGVTFPAHSPSMVRLTSLGINAKNPSIPFHPSFRMSTLVSLKLGGFCGVLPTLVASFVQLFNTLSSTTLCHLELDNLLDSAWDAFLLSLQSTTIPKYPGLKTLTMRSLQLRVVDANFAAAFPAITHLNLFEVDPSPILLLMRDNVSVWQGLTLSTDQV
jgi:hypothetical protein